MVMGALAGSVRVAKIPRVIRLVMEMEWHYRMTSNTVRRRQLADPWLRRKVSVFLAGSYNALGMSASSTRAWLW